MDTNLRFGTKARADCCDKDGLIGIDIIADVLVKDAPEWEKVINNDLSPVLTRDRVVAIELFAKTWQELRRQNCIEPAPFPVDVVSE